MKPSERFLHTFGVYLDHLRELRGETTTEDMLIAVKKAAVGLDPVDPESEGAKEAKRLFNAQFTKDDLGG